MAFHLQVKLVTLPPPPAPLGSNSLLCVCVWLGSTWSELESRALAQLQPQGMPQSCNNLSTVWPYGKLVDVCFKPTPHSAPFLCFVYSITSELCKPCAQPAVALRLDVLWSHRWSEAVRTVPVQPRASPWAPKMVVVSLGASVLL